MPHPVPVLSTKRELQWREQIGQQQRIGLRDDQECYKEIETGKAIFERYSPKAVEKIEHALKKESAEAVWKKRRAKARRAG